MKGNPVSLWALHVDTALDVTTFLPLPQACQLPLSIQIYVRPQGEFWDLLPTPKSVTQVDILAYATCMVDTIAPAARHGERFSACCLAWWTP